MRGRVTDTITVVSTAFILVAVFDDFSNLRYVVSAIFGLAAGLGYSALYDLRNDATLKSIVIWSGIRTWFLMGTLYVNAVVIADNIYLGIGIHTLSAYAATQLFDDWFGGWQWLQKRKRYH